MPSIFDLPIPMRPASWWYSSDGRCVPARELSYVLVAELLAAGQTRTVAELVESLTARRLSVTAPVNKNVSDALPAPRARGRVVRVGRGRYRAGSMPKSTRSYIQKRAARTVELYRAPTEPRPCWAEACPIPELELGPDANEPWGLCWSCYAERNRSASTNAAVAASRSSIGRPERWAMSESECSPSEYASIHNSPISVDFEFTAPPTAV